jgi:hypothetical protein
MPLLKAAVAVNEDMAALVQRAERDGRADGAAARGEIDLTDPLPAPASGRANRA